MALLIMCDDVAYCFHGEEWLLEREPDDRSHADTIDSRDGHPVEIYDHRRSGWYLRGGRLPICPEHRMDGDVPMEEPR